MNERHDEIPAEHLKQRDHKVCPACFHNWLVPKGSMNEKCPVCKHDPNDIPPASLDGDPVLQPWVMKLTWKMQSILFSSLRGPDQEYLVNIKQVSKWMRSVTQNNADPSKPYMNGIQLPEVEALYKELEHCPCHFVHHFLDGLAIIAYFHPIEIVAEYAARVHYMCAEELFHFYPEQPEYFKMRHRDKRGGNDDRASQWKSFETAQRSVYMADALGRFKR
jgi:hypothetical protein